MRVRFWGSRGSIPVALTSADLRRKLEKAILAALDRGLRSAEDVRRFLEHDLELSVAHTYGGHSPCVEIDAGSDELIICDMGSGARPLGVSLLARARSRPLVINVFMSHVHWDHIMGFPFFAPAYDPAATIRIYGCHDVIEEAFRVQQSAPFFPVDFSRLAARIEFFKLTADAAATIAGFKVVPMLQRHTGDSYGYRFERQGKSIVYSTDSEHKLEDARQTAAFTEFFRGADLVIFDAMYSLAEAVSVKEDWGHSSNIVAVELAQMAEVKRLCLFHHEPAFDDERIEAVLRDTLRFEELTRGGRAALAVCAAYDGLELEV
jgi:phosphoribosyl 1,2-cyclic phosphodiesterase